MSREFAIQTIDSGTNTTVLRVRGRLDARTGPALVAACNEVRTRGRHLVLNLVEVSFIASSGIGALLALVEEYRQARLQVRLAPVSPAVESVVELLNLRQFLCLDANEDAAVSALREAA